MNRKLVKEWIEALRSGKYKQGRYRLKTDDTYCCLGVAVEIHPKCSFVNDAETMNLEKTNNTVFISDRTCHLSRNIRTDFGLDFDVECELIHINDIQGLNFKAIADWIEVNILGEEEERSQEAAKSREGMVIRAMC